MGQVGSLFKRITALFAQSFKRETRVLMIGLDAAGKTTILNQLKLNEFLNTIPTIGFNVDQVQYKNLDMTIWDVGGQGKIRALWRHYYHNVDAVVWVVDSADKTRFEESKDELHHVLASDELRGAHLLVYGNKSDMSNALPPFQLAERLGLNKLRNRRWHLQPSVATNGDGLYEGFDWLASAVNQQDNK